MVCLCSVLLPSWPWRGPWDARVHAQVAACSLQPRSWAGSRVSVQALVWTSFPWQRHRACGWGAGPGCRIGPGLSRNRKEMFISPHSSSFWSWTELKRAGSRRPSAAIRLFIHLECRVHACALITGAQLDWLLLHKLPVLPGTNVNRLFILLFLQKYWSYFRRSNFTKSQNLFLVPTCAMLEKKKRVFCVKVYLFVKYCCYLCFF